MLIKLVLDNSFLGPDTPCHNGNIDRKYSLNGSLQGNPFCGLFFHIRVGKSFWDKKLRPIRKSFWDKKLRPIRKSFWDRRSILYIIFVSKLFSF